MLYIVFHLVSKSMPHRNYYQIGSSKLLAVNKTNPQSLLHRGFKGRILLLVYIYFPLQMDSLTVWILIAAYRVLAKTNPTAVACLILRISLARVCNHHLNKLPSPSMIESVFL